MYLLNILQNMLNAVAAALAPGRRHRAIGAIIVTAVLNLQKRTGTVVGRIGREERRGIRNRLSHNPWHGIQLVAITENCLYPSPLANLLGAQRRVATYYHNARIGVLTMQMGHIIPHLFLRRMGHRTTVHHNSLRLVRLLPAQLPQAARHVGRLAEIQFTAKSMYRKSMIIHDYLQQFY